VYFAVAWEVATIALVGTEAVVISYATECIFLLINESIVLIFLQKCNK
jgi:hypothetical protein